MYKLTNLRPRNTSVALPGKGLLLARNGAEGDSDEILDREADDPHVRSLVRQRAVKLEKLPKADPPESAGVKKELRRIAVTKRAEARAAMRAAGKLPPKTDKSAEGEPSPKAQAAPLPPTPMAPPPTPAGKKKKRPASTKKES